MSGASFTTVSFESASGLSIAGSPGCDASKSPLPSKDALECSLVVEEAVVVDGGTLFGLADCLLHAFADSLRDDFPRVAEGVELQLFSSTFRRIWEVTGELLPDGVLDAAD